MNMTLSMEKSMKIKVGDIITCYHKGYHRVDNIKPRDNPPTPNNFIVYYTKVANSDGKPSRNLKNHCHIDYCNIVDRYRIEGDYQNELTAAKNKRDSLIKLLKENE